MSDLLKRLGWTTSLALCAVPIGAGCGGEAADEDMDGDVEYTDGMSGGAMEGPGGEVDIMDSIEEEDLTPEPMPEPTVEPAVEPETEVEPAPVEPAPSPPQPSPLPNRPTSPPRSRPTSRLPNPRLEAGNS